MKILLTGASGVIGQSLIKMLVKYSTEIDATYFSNKISIKSDVCKLNFIHYSDIFKSDFIRQYDQIWHFATYGQPAKFIESWSDVVKLNVYDLQYLINLLKPDGHFFFASTSELYGNSKSNELTIPSSNPLSKRAVYTESKRLGEAIINTTLENRSTFFRICLAYSPNFSLDDRRVIYELVIKGLLNDSIKLLDDGSSDRQYLFIDDAINMMENIVFKQKEENRNIQGVWNICNPNHITIFELAESIGNYLDIPIIKGIKGSNPFHALSKIDITPSRYIDVFGEYKYTSISTGIKKLIDSARLKLDKNS